MDSNVSKNTFFYKFIQLQLSQKNWAIEDLLKQDLLRTIDLYNQRQNIDIELPVIANKLEGKILLLRSSYLTSFFNDRQGQVNSKLPFTNFVYRCAIAFPLASYCQLSPQHIARELAQNMGLFSSSLTNAGCLEFAVVAHTSGYLDFYLKETSLAIWLERALDCLAKKSITSPNYAPIYIEPPKNKHNLVPLQYVHSRCCSLLRLGEREKLIELSDYATAYPRARNFEYLIWHIAKPKSISWLDAEDRLWLSHQAEYDLLLQLLTVVDASGEITGSPVADVKSATRTTKNSGNWYKLAANLSEAMLIFDAECRIMGEIKQSFPQKAIARLGLIALVQYWLQQLLYLVVSC